MYQKRKTQDSVIAVVFYFIMISTYLMMGYLYRKEVSMYRVPAYCLFAAVILLMSVKEKNLSCLGKKDNIMRNGFISAVIISVTFAVSIGISNQPFNKLLHCALLNLFYVAIIEEVLFRGFLQSYLFGLTFNRKAIYLIGAVAFSLVHIPFQIGAAGTYSVTAGLPQLLSALVCHLVFCFLAYKTEDITIPIALHFLWDYLQAI